ncbi:MAG TPA: tripartite tricarboxylate transporter substrate binding protein [Burkholderiales bacterium]|jgi:tripartite-type tricarboxylate transporter receptor subunit TctC|nr:tripartite tricarboxylate transporter substrate binding protein [Burkholderiales bacterium]
MKQRIISSFVGFTCAVCTATAYGQAYPTKPIRIVAPFAPGGGTDLIARVAAQKLSESLGQQAVVDNRPGAGGVLGAELGAKAPPDGYTFTLIAGSYAVNPSLFKLNFDPINDITPVIQLSQGPFLVVVHPSLPVKNIKELVALAKAKPAQLTFASSGAGSITQLATELFADMAGIKMIHIPYKGTGPALTDTMAGQVQILFGSVGATLPQLSSGRLRAIAVTTEKRIAAAPTVPTIDESGVKGYNVILWHGLIAPKNLPRPILDRVNGDLNKALQAKDMQERLAGDGVSAAGGTPEQFAALIKKDIEVWRAVVKKAGVKAE